MKEKYKPIGGDFGFLHGGDYNPEQWKSYPQILEEDIRLMKKANCNSATINIFSWASLEPEEGKFEYIFLDDVIERLWKNGISIVLATPSGARPAWLSAKYPEVLRVGSDRVRNLHGGRHNHCYTSPVYREKCSEMNRRLAERYKKHPALMLWHVSNEYGGECHCELCQQAFREWLKAQYDNDLDKLNHSWWTGFWSHTFSDWSEIESPAPHGEFLLHGHNLDWKRFVTHQTIDFYKCEAAPLRELTPGIPVTTNFMGTYTGIDYWKFAKEIDVASWDCYPRWHGKQSYDLGRDSSAKICVDSELSDWRLAGSVAFVHDLNRSLKGGKPFMLMESTPSTTNWQPVCKLKRPGMHQLSSIQAIAHGADTVQYFQWRKSRGSSEKFHGAVVDHCGHENTRVFCEASQVGDILKRIGDIAGTTVNAEAAVIYDWENRWALDDSKGPRADEGTNYLRTCEDHYRQLWESGVPVDVIDMDCDFSKYKLLSAPMLYMIKPGVAERIKSFVSRGGVFITTYWSGIVDKNDLCFLNGFPGPIRDVMGIWSEELDALYDSDKNTMVLSEDNPLRLKGEYPLHSLCDIIHTEGARVLASYKNDFYAGMPALTVNSYGTGSAYYIAARTNDDFLSDFYKSVIKQSKLKSVLNTEIPKGISVHKRTDGENDYIFIMNFTFNKKNISIGNNDFFDMLDNKTVTGTISLNPLGFKIFKTRNRQ